MTYTYTKVLPSWVAIFVFFSFCACSYVEEVEVESLQPSAEQKSIDEEGPIHVRIPAFSIQTIATVSAIDLYQFSDGVFEKEITVDPSKDNVVEFDRKPLTRIYALAGHTVDGAHKMSEHDFAMMTIPVPKDSYSAPVFFTSVIDLYYDSDNISIEMFRGVA